VKKNNIEGRLSNSQLNNIGDVLKRKSIIASENINNLDHEPKIKK